MAESSRISKCYSPENVQKITKQCVSTSEGKGLKAVAQCIKDAFELCEKPKFKLSGKLKYKFKFGPLKEAPDRGLDSIFGIGINMNYIMSINTFDNILNKQLKKAGIKGKEAEEFKKRFEALYVQISKGVMAKNEFGSFGLVYVEIKPADKCRATEIVTNAIATAIKTYQLIEPGCENKGLVMADVVEMARSKVEGLQDQYKNRLTVKEFLPFYPMLPYQPIRPFDPFAPQWPDKEEPNIFGPNDIEYFLDGIRFYLEDTKIPKSTQIPEETRNPSYINIDMEFPEIKF